MELQAQANMARTIADREANAIRKVAAATREAQDPMFLRLRLIEVERKRIEKCNGHYPVYLMQLGSDKANAPDLLLQIMPIELTADSRRTDRQ